MKFGAGDFLQKKIYQAVVSALKMVLLSFTVLKA